MGTSTSSYDRGGRPQAALAYFPRHSPTHIYSRQSAGWDRPHSVHVNEKLAQTKLLRVSRTASPVEIKASYHRLLSHHSDESDAFGKNPIRTDIDIGSLKEAFTTIFSPGSRIKYDSELSSCSDPSSSRSRPVYYRRCRYEGHASDSLFELLRGHIGRVRSLPFRRYDPQQAINHS